MTRPRRTVLGLVLAGTIVVAGLAAAARPIVAIGTAYAAKVTCSEVFIARRDVARVVEQLAIDDLAPLRMIRVNVDTARRTVRARRFPFGARSAAFDPDAGCVLVPAGSQPDDVPRRVSDSSTRSSAIPVAIADMNPRLERVLDEAFMEPDGAHPRRTRAIVVMSEGGIVAERYADGTGPDTPLPGWSMAKSVLNALVGIAVRDGLITRETSIDVAAWPAGDPRRRITVSDLLHMSSGFRFDDDQSATSSDVVRMLFTAGDMAAFAASSPLAAEPGTSWRYSSGGSLVLSRFLRDALGDSAYRSFPRKQLFERLGMSRAVAETDASGTFVLSSYVYATAREWARFGQLYLQDGVWNGERILPDGWVAWSRTPAPSSSNGSYGALFWLATPDEYRGPPAPLPDGIFHAVGHEGQFVTIVPSERVVIVRLGRTRHAEAWAHDRFVAAVIDALRDGH